jgi:hypothetical protein
MTLASLIAGGGYGEAPLRFAPTDLAGYLRLDQCERFLKLQIHYRNAGSDFMTEMDVVPRALSPVLSDIGRAFEATVIEQLQRAMPVIDYSLQRTTATDNLELIRALLELPVGERIALTQPRLGATLAGWALRGDIDLLLIERSASGYRCTILDMKSSVTSKVEHRVQVAVYREMLESLLIGTGVAAVEVRIGILYRGTAHPEQLSDEDRELDDLRRAAAEALGIADARLELTDPDVLYRDAVDDLLLGENALARRVATSPLDATEFEFTPRCDGCFFNEVCLKRSAETDDLSLLPFVGVDAKRALAEHGVTTTRALAGLMAPRVVEVAGIERKTLAPVPEEGGRCQAIAEQRAIAGRLPELVSRARRYRQASGDDISERNTIPSAGYGSLPYCAPDHDPNLVRIFIDAQRDHTVDRLYLLSALIQANENGLPAVERRRSIVKLTSEPPATDEIERALLVEFLSELLTWVIELAAPGDDGISAPLHVILYDGSQLRSLLQALGRHADTVLGSTALFDFMTQLPAFDSPLVSLLSDDIRNLKNYPVLAPSLYAVARFLGFDWDGEQQLTETFRAGIFDDQRPMDDGEEWFTGRARFSSDIPLEYAYELWGDKPTEVTREAFLAFAGRRLNALEAITADFPGNNRSYKTPFDLSSIALFEEGIESLAAAIDQFIVTERHVALTAWKGERQAPPEQRMLAGVSLVARYHEADQIPGVAEQNRGHGVKSARRAELLDQLRLETPDEPVKLSKEQNAEVRWDHIGTEYRFELVHPGGSEGIERLLGVSQLRVGDRVAIAERWSVDTRLPVEERTPFQTTAKQLLYGDRAEIVGFERVPSDPSRTLLRVRMVRGQFSGEPGFIFTARSRVFEEGTTYTFESDPNDIMLSRGRKLARAIEAGSINALCERLAGDALMVSWPESAAEAQARFDQGLRALFERGMYHDFEPGKRRYIGQLGDVPTVLVQGPPGTGKSHTTAFAIWARVQGAIAAGKPYRVMISCKTHAATALLLKEVAVVKEWLALLHLREPELFSSFFDERLLDVPVYRFEGKEGDVHGIRRLFARDHPTMEGQRTADLLANREYAVVGMTPGGNWKLITERWKDYFANRFMQLVVLDEASQMSIPEAIMATLTLDLEGQLIVVGDHRQMPPIVQHDWANEARRAFKRFAVFESLYLALDRRVEDDHKIKFAESFRLHRDMAEFLRREIYHLDDIPYFSRKTAQLPERAGEPGFADAVLGAEPLTIVLHTERGSQVSNRFEERLITNLIDGFATLDGLKPNEHVGVVVPHRAQRSALQERVKALTRRDPLTGNITASAVDTVERFQGDERRAIIVSLTESDPYFIRTTSEFLLDPRRLTVALSRAKEKLIVIASRSIFEVIASDDALFANAGLWKNLLRRTCTDLQWSGEIDQHQVEVWTNPPLVAD